MIPFIGFAPDIPPETEGAIVDCSNLLPCVGGFEPARTRVSLMGSTLISNGARGFAVVRNVDNSNRAFCGNDQSLLEISSGSYTDVSKVGGYTLGSDDRWRFAQFGNVTLAAAKSETIQSLTSSTFGDLSASAPKAAIVETCGNQVFAFNINGMGLGDVLNGWGCCAVGDETDWTPSIDTGCVAGTFLDSPGPVTAGRRLGEYIVAYKDKAIYMASYVGAPAWWDWRRIPGEIGAPSQEAVINTGTLHYFVGPDDFYVFDGTRPQVLVSGLRNWFFNNVDRAYMYKIWGAFDRNNQRIFWWFPSNGSGGVLDKCISYNIKTNQWGRMDSQIDAAAEYVSSGITYAGLGSVYTNYSDLPTTISYDSPFWSAGSSVLAVFGTDKKLYQYSGVPDTSSITTWTIGDNIQFSTVTKVRPRFIKAPTSSTLAHYYSNEDAETFTTGPTSTYSGKWYDILQSARWHKMRLDFVGDMKISGVDVVRVPDGVE